MKCRQCGNEVFIDHVKKSEDGRVETYAYACVNPQCRNYRKAETLMGEAAEMKMEERK